MQVPGLPIKDNGYPENMSGVTGGPEEGNTTLAKIKQVNLFSGVCFYSQLPGKGSRTQFASIKMPLSLHIGNRSPISNT